MTKRFLVFLAVKNLRTRKLRSFLTIGGMMIGIGSIVFLVSLGFGLQRLVISQITNVEALTVLDVTTGTSALLSIDDNTITSLSEQPGVKQVSPSVNLSGQVKYQNILTDVAVFGIDPQFIALEGVNIIAGDNLLAEESGTLVSRTTADLLGFVNPLDIVGKTVSYDLIVPDTEASAKDNVRSVDVKVTGVVADELAVGYLPLKLASELGFHDYNLLRVKVENRDALVSVRQYLEALGYQADSVADTVGQIDRIFFMIEIAMAALGFIAMFVASLGTFNTLTVSLLERTREIGIMKSIGATRRDVYYLFMFEAIVIGFVGAFLGLVSGLVFGNVLNVAINILARQFGGVPVDIFYTPLFFLVILFTFVFLLSVVTGAYPARRAARLNPLDAIRYE